MEQKSIPVFKGLYLEVTSTGTSTRVSTMISPLMKVSGNALVVAGIVQNSSNLASGNQLVVIIYGANDPNSLVPVSTTNVTLVNGEPTPFSSSVSGSWSYPFVMVRVTISAPDSGTARMVLDAFLGMSSL